VEPPAPTDTSPAEGGKSGTAFGLVLVALLPLGLAAQLTRPLAGLLWTEPFVFLLPAVVVAAGSNLDPRAWLRLRPASRTAVAGGALVGVAGWFLGSAVFATARALAPASLVARYDLTRIFEGPVVEQLGFAVAASVIAPVCEEVAFRGQLASAYHSRHAPAFAIGASAILFALLHLDPLRGPALLVLGALYGWLAWRTGSIWPAVVAHAVNNGIASALALALGDGGARVEPTLGDALVGVAVGAAAAAAAVSAFRALVPAAPRAPGLPLANPADPSTRFRPALVPRPLRWAVAAGWVGLGAILLSR
jgi:membrane protease YdiL (CAAX protease family)